MTVIPGLVRKTLVPAAILAAIALSAQHSNAQTFNATKLTGYWKKISYEQSGGQIVARGVVQFATKTINYTDTFTTLLHFGTDGKVYVITMGTFPTEPQVVNPDRNLFAENGQPFKVEGSTLVFDPIMEGQQILAEGRQQTLLTLTDDVLVFNIIARNYAVPPTLKDTYKKITREEAQTLATPPTGSFRQIPPGFFP